MNSIEFKYLCIKATQLPKHLFNSRKHPSKELDHLSDEQLVNRYAREGDVNCLGLLFERYTHLLFPVCMKYLGNEAEAEDMVMMVFERLFEELKKTEVKNFKSWLYTVAKNQCLMYLRHHKTLERSRQEILKDLQSEIMESEEAVHLLSGENRNDDEGLLIAAIGKLNEAQRRCVELFYLQEQSYKEVADQTGYSMNEVKSYLQNGKRNLKIFLEKARE